MYRIHIILILATQLVIAQEADHLASISELRLQGKLEEALDRSLTIIDASSLSPVQEFHLRLELAKVYDRIGLHQNTRPVAESLEQIEQAAGLLPGIGDRERALIMLAKADYYYRAEMAGREFQHATDYAERAIAMFRDLDDLHHEADAVHRLGLIHLQQGKLAIARELFDKSLELDKAGGERMIFAGDYSRHVAFVYILSEERNLAIPYLMQSLESRRAAGAIDAAMFAANTLASSLVELGQIEKAWDPLVYAIIVADRIDSPIGRVRNGLVLGRLYEHTGDHRAARMAYERALEIALELDSRSSIDQAKLAIENLKE